MLLLNHSYNLNVEGKNKKMNLKNIIQNYRETKQRKKEEEYRITNNTTAYRINNDDNQVIIYNPRLNEFENHTMEYKTNFENFKPFQTLLKDTTNINKMLGTFKKAHKSKRKANQNELQKYINQEIKDLHYLHLTWTKINPSTNIKPYNNNNHTIKNKIKETISNYFSVTLGSLKT